MSLASALRISGSVGRNGQNVSSDVATVQQLINEHLPIPLKPLDVDGQCGPFTIGAIEEIQRRFLSMNPADGKVDPNAATFGFLSGTTVPAKPKPDPGAGTFPAGNRCRRSLE